MYDLLVKNGLVANEYNVLPLDVAVKDEKVVALARIIVENTQLAIRHVVPAGHVRVQPRQYAAGKPTT